MKYIKVFNESKATDVVISDIENKFKDMFQELPDMGFESDMDIMFYNGKLEKSFDDIAVSDNSLVTIFEKFTGDNLYIAICMDTELRDNEEWLTTDNDDLFNILSVLKVKQDNYPEYKIFYTLDNGKLTTFILTNILFLTKEKLDMINSIYLNADNLMMRYLNNEKKYTRFGEFISNNEFTIKNSLSKNIIDSDFFRQNFESIEDETYQIRIKFK